MRILIVAATGFEVLPLTDFLQKKAIQTSPASYQFGQLEIWVLITGVGQVATTYALGKALQGLSLNLVIHAGIAGSFDLDKYPVGAVVQVLADTFADLGVEEKDGSFIPATTMELVDPNAPPYTNGWLKAPEESNLPTLPKATGVTVNRVHGQVASIQQVQAIFTPDIETMESAACFFVCLMEKIPFLEIRSISNKVEPRNRAAWNIPLAIENLNAVLVELVRQFSASAS